jgi:hypothetical protein
MTPLWMSDPDPYRRTGRTTNMLKMASRRFLEGFDVIVTAHSFRYALDLQYIVLSYFNKVPGHVCYCESKNHIIYGWEYNEMVFTKHFSSQYRMVDCREISFQKTYLLFKDHYKGDDNE